MAESVGMAVDLRPPELALDGASLAEGSMNWIIAFIVVWLACIAWFAIAHAKWGQDRFHD